MPDSHCHNPSAASSRVRGQVLPFSPVARRAVVLGALLALAITVSNCGGGSAAPCTPVAQVHIQLFGDSTMFGQQPFTLGLSPANPLATLQLAMNTRFGAGKVVVVQRAVNGSDSLKLINGTDGLNTPWPGPVAADIVLVNHGINDASHGIPLATYRTHFEQFALAPARVIFQTPVPSHGRAFDVAPYAEAQRTVARTLGLPVADVYAWFVAQPDWQRLVPDGVHPSDEGYAAMVAGAMVPAVTPAVAGLLCVR